MSLWNKDSAKGKKSKVKPHLDVEPKPPGDLVASGGITESENGTQLQIPPEPKKRAYKRTGKYSKKPPEPEPEPQADKWKADGLKPLVLFASTYLEKRLGNWAAFDKEELEQLPPILEGLANKYITIVNEYPEETAALMFISAWISKRMKKLWEIFSNEPKQSKKAPPNDTAAKND